MHQDGNPHRTTPTPRKSKPQTRRNASFNVESLEPRLQLSVAPAADAAQLLPDLTPWISRPKQYVYGWSLDTTEMPGHVLLRFTSAVANIGLGPMELRRGATRGPSGQDVYQRIFNDDGTYYDVLAGIFVRHPAHQHFHFNDFALYRLRQDLPDGTPGKVVASGRKTSFCLTDSDEYNPDLPNAAPVGNYFSCSTKKQGISVGWADVYTKSLADQWIDVTKVPDGKYWLEVVIDPDNNLQEANDENNSDRILINLKQPQKPKNDDFDNRIELSGKLAIGRANTIQATRESNESDQTGLQGGASVWWTWTSSKNGKVIISTNGSDFDTLLGVYTGNNLTDLQRIAANDDSSHGGSRSSRVQFQATKGTTYQIAVDGYRGATGHVKLKLTQS